MSQIFCNIRYISAAIDVLAAVVKEMNNNGLWNAEIAWGWLSCITHRISIDDLKHGRGIHHFRSTWSRLIVDD